MHKSIHKGSTWFDWFFYSLSAVCLLISTSCCADCFSVQTGFECDCAILFAVAIALVDILGTSHYRPGNCLCEVVTQKRALPQPLVEGSVCIQVRKELGKGSLQGLERM